MEALSGQTQYGRARDDLGNWFGGNNSDPLWHYVLDDRYLSRNPLLRAAVGAPPGARGARAGAGVSGQSHAAALQRL